MNTMTLPWPWVLLAPAWAITLIVVTRWVVAVNRTEVVPMLSLGLASMACATATTALTVVVIFG